MRVDITAEDERKLRDFVDRRRHWADRGRQHGQACNIQIVRLIGRIVLRILQAAEQDEDYQAEQTERLNP